MNQAIDERNNVASSLPWEEMLQMAENEGFNEAFQDISQEALEFAIDEKNEQVLVKTALKVLRTTEPGKANIEYAANVADKMKKFAKEYLAKNNN